MSAYTQSPDDRDLPHLLDGLAAIPQVLVVLNHPFWLEEGVEAGVHRGALQILLGGHLTVDPRFRVERHQGVVGKPRHRDVGRAA